MIETSPVPWQSQFFVQGFFLRLARLSFINTLGKMRLCLINCNWRLPASKEQLLRQPASKETAILPLNSFHNIETKNFPAN